MLEFCIFSLVSQWAHIHPVWALAAIHPRWGNRYSKSWMLENDQAAQKELKRLRSLSGNTYCPTPGGQQQGPTPGEWGPLAHQGK